MQNLKIERRGNTAIIEFHGEQLIEYVLEQKNKIAEVIEDAENLQIVFGDDVRLHAAQLQLILSLMSDFQQQGRKVKTVGAEKGSIRKQLEIAGCFSFFN